jgi:transposase InsO family protein
MTIPQKVALVASVRETHSLAAALSAVGLAKATWYYQQQRAGYADKYAPLRPVVEEVVRQHPAYGIRRVTAELRARYPQVVNHKVVARLLQLWELALLRSTHAPSPSPIQRTIAAAGERANLVASLTAIGLFEVVYTDFTELRYAGGERKAYLMPLLEHACKLVLGWAVGVTDNSDLALVAWEHAKRAFGTHGLAYRGLIVHHDQDGVYTGYAWTSQLLLNDGVRLSYALHGAKDNPEIEAFFSRFKSENQSLLLEAADLDQLRQVVDRQMGYYNTDRRHSSLGYLSPLAYLRQVQTQ